MADAVRSIVLANTPTHYAVNITNISDGTGESAVVKVDKSALTASDGAEPGSLDIEAIRWSIQGFSSVKIAWDHDTDDVAAVPSGSGYEDYRGGGFLPGVLETEGLKDPRSTGGTGDIVLTTVGASATATYDITIWCRKNPD